MQAAYLVRKFEYILTRLIAEPLPSILKEYDIQPIEFFSYLRSNEAYSKKYQTIMQDKADFLAEEMMHIVDTDPDPVRARNRANVRQWYASKLQPIKYGDRMNVAVDRVDLSGALQEARSRVLHPCFTPTLPSVQVIDMPSEKRSYATNNQPVVSLEDIL